MLEEKIRRLYLCRRPLWDMAVSQLKAKYAGSYLGIWWAVFTPLLLAASINFVFGKVFKVGINNYTLYVLAGIIPWLFSTNALLEATNSFSAKAAVFKQAILPAELIPLSSILANFLNFLIGFIFLLPVFIIVNFQVVKFTPFLFIVLLLHFLFVLGLGFLFSLANVFFRDFTHFLSIFIMIWFWITPIFYSADMLPWPFRLVCLLNPMSYYVMLYQHVLFQAKMPSPAILSVSSLLSILFFLAGYLTFAKNEPRLLKVI